jgi:hypothetical protein
MDILCKLELPNTTGLGLELIAEAKESEVGHDLGGSFLFQVRFRHNCAFI